MRGSPELARVGARDARRRRGRLRRLRAHPRGARGGRRPRRPRRTRCRRASTSTSSGPSRATEALAGAARGGAARPAEPGQRERAAARTRATPSGSPRSSRDDEPTVVYFGKLIYNKGVHVLLEALRGLDARAVIVGFGDYREELEALAPPRHALHRRRSSTATSSTCCRSRDVDRRAVDLPRGVRDGRGRGGRRRLAAARRAPLGPRRGRGRARGGVPAGATAHLASFAHGRRRRPRREARASCSRSAGRARAQLGAAAPPRRRALELGGRRRAAARAASTNLGFARGRRAAPQLRGAARARARAVRRRRRLHGRRRGGVRAPRPGDARRSSTASRSCRRRREGTALEPHLVGELIASEVEVRTGRCETFAEAAALHRRAPRAAARARRAARRRARRDRHAPVEPAGRSSGSSTRRTTAATTSSCATSSGATTPSGCTSTSAINGADRAIRVCNACATSCRSCSRSPRARRSSRASSRGLHSARTQIFTRMFPRCGVPDALRRLGRASRRTSASSTRRGSIDEHTQIWWSVRPHLAFPTVEIRICDAQPDLGEARSLAALVYALTARIARALDEGEPLPDLPHRLIEENLWRAIRYGLSGELIDFETRRVDPARARGSSGSSTGCGRSPRSSARASGSRSPSGTRPSARSRATRRARACGRSSPSRSAGTSARPLRDTADPAVW